MHQPNDAKKGYGAETVLLFWFTVTLIFAGSRSKLIGISVSTFEVFIKVYNNKSKWRHGIHCVNGQTDGHTIWYKYTPSSRIPVWYTPLPQVVSVSLNKTGDAFVCRSFYVLVWSLFRNHFFDQPVRATTKTGKRKGGEISKPARACRGILQYENITSTMNLKVCLI